MDNIIIKKIWNDSGSVMRDSNFIFKVKMTFKNENLNNCTKYANEFIKNK